MPVLTYSDNTFEIVNDEYISGYNMKYIWEKLDKMAELKGKNKSNPISRGA